MATTYYLVASGNVNAAAPFSLTSGGAGGAGIPTTGDTIICNAASGAAALAINVTVSLVKFDCLGFTGTVTHAAVVLTITGSGIGTFRLSAAMTYVPAALGAVVVFANTSGVAQLTSGGQRFAAITQNGVGGSVQMQDDLAVNLVTNSTLTVTAGIWDCNSALGCKLTACIISSSNANVRSFIMAGDVTIGGSITNNQAIFAFSTITNLTFVKNSANIIVLGPLTAVFSMTFSPPPGVVLNDVTFNPTNFDCFVYTGAAAFTAATWTLGAGWTQQFGAGFAATNLTLAGTATSPVGIQYNSVLAAGVVTVSGTVTANWAVLQNCTASGAASFSATNSLGIGVNAGWTISPPANMIDAPTIAAAIWRDLLSSSDFATAGSVGAVLKALANTVNAIGRGVAGAGATTTSVPTSAFTPAGAAANQFVGAVILFDGATATPALRGQRATVSASSNAANPVLTVSALTTAPSAGDAFSVI